MFVFIPGIQVINISALNISECIREGGRIKHCCSVPPACLEGSRRLGKEVTEAIKPVCIQSKVKYVLSDTLLLPGTKHIHQSQTAHYKNRNINIT